MDEEVSGEAADLTPFAMVIKGRLDEAWDDIEAMAPNTASRILDDPTDDNVQAVLKELLIAGFFHGALAGLFHQQEFLDAVPERFRTTESVTYSFVQRWPGGPWVEREL
jgi:hypothetical protein